MFESMARNLTKSDYKVCTQRKREQKRFRDAIMKKTDSNLNLSASDQFRTRSFYVIIDKLITEMGKRRAAYATLHERFNFFLIDLCQVMT